MKVKAINDFKAETAFYFQRRSQRNHLPTVKKKAKEIKEFTYN